MKAIASRYASEARDRGRPVPAFLLSVALVVALPVVAAEQDTAAVLKLHDVSFVYRTSTAMLSCGEIQGRVHSVLRTLGAREDLEIRVNGCDTVVMPLERDADTWPEESDPYGTSSDPWRRSSDPFDRSGDEWGPSSDRFRRRGMGPKQSTHVHIRAMMPVEMTPQVQAELKKDKSRRELVSRVNPSAGLSEPIVFPAERRLVELSRSTIDLEPEECELMEQLSKSIFKKVGIRVVRRPSCSRDRISSIAPKLTVEALLPKLPAIPQLTPAAGERDAERRKSD